MKPDQSQRERTRLDEDRRSFVVAFCSYWGASAATTLLSKVKLGTKIASVCGLAVAAQSLQADWSREEETRRTTSRKPSDVQGREQSVSLYPQQARQVKLQGVVLPGSRREDKKRRRDKGKRGEEKFNEVDAFDSSRPRMATTAPS